jgi:uncharacterized protein (TIGR02996 family)
MIADERALLNAIIAAPEDDLPRLVYADWLEEHGRAERAEFIRLECELARMGFNPIRRRKLEKRLRLWNSLYGERRRRELPSVGSASCSWGRHERGFVNSIVIMLAPDTNLPPATVLECAPLQVAHAYIPFPDYGETAQFLDWCGLHRFKQVILDGRVEDRGGWPDDGRAMIQAIAEQNWGEKPEILDLSYFMPPDEDLQILADVPKGRRMPRLVLRRWTRIRPISTQLRRRYGDRIQL